MSKSLIITVSPGNMTVTMEGLETVTLTLYDIKEAVEIVEHFTAIGRVCQDVLDKRKMENG